MYARLYVETAGLLDNVYVSFFEGIGAMAGATLAGSTAFIAEARIWQRRHGGNLVHLYPIVLSAPANLRRRLDGFPRCRDQSQAVAGAVRDQIAMQWSSRALRSQGLHAGRLHTALQLSVRPTDRADRWHDQPNRLVQTLFHRIRSTCLDGPPWHPVWTLHSTEPLR